LAVFGIVHGLHEWYELILLQGQWQGVELPRPLFFLRLVMLSVTFVSLIAYGIQVLSPPRGLAATDAYVGGGMLALYAAMVLFIVAITPNGINDWMRRADVLARYVLAIPGSILAVFALNRQSQFANQEGRSKLSLSLIWATWGFGLYGLTQIFVPKSNIFPANFLNTEAFIEVTGLPIQVFRAVLGIIITIALIRATQVVEKDRQDELTTAQEARYAALQRVQEELVKQEEMRRELLRHTVIAQEEERTRIARELHDELAQILTGFSLDLATLKTHCTSDEAIAAAVGRLQDLSRQMSQGLYQLVHDLRPAQLDDLGLVAALQHLVDDVRSRMKMEITLDIVGERQSMDPLVETVFFRVTQEALTNIVRHAQTNQTSLQLYFHPKQTMLQIRDYGVGFDTEVLENPKGKLGIAGMRERVRSVDGQFMLESNLGDGTLIEVSVPSIRLLGDEQEERVDENHPTITG